MKSKNEIFALFRLLQHKNDIVIQTHNFPDHDAIASAYALQKLMERFSMHPEITYDGAIERESLRLMIEDLHIKIKHINDINITSDTQIIIVDGCIDNKNVAQLPGKYIGVIDHHVVEQPDDVYFCDIRPEYGSTSTVIYEYYLKTHQTFTRNVASAMMIGLNKDTASLTRGVTYHDIISYSDLWNHADMEYVHKIMRNEIQIDDLDYYHKAIRLLKTEQNFGFVFFDEPCAQNLLGILGDFFLTLKELEFVVVAAKNQNRVNLSIRSDKEEWNAANVIETVLEGIGFGGGHEDMAGGIITSIEKISNEELFLRFKNLLFTSLSK